MQDKELKISELMTSLFVEIARGIERFEYKDSDGKAHKIGSGVILIYFVGSHQTRTMSEVADYLQVSHQRNIATRKVEKLVKMDLMRRVHDDEDRRIISLELTGEGKTIYNRFLERRSKVMKRIATNFSDQELDIFYTVFDKFIAEFKKERRRM